MIMNKMIVKPGSHRINSILFIYTSNFHVGSNSFPEGLY